MKKYLLIVLIGFCLSACNSGVDAPDVSGISVNLESQRFEQDFFALDTNRLVSSIQQLQAKYPGFTNDFVVNILGIPFLQQPDTMSERLLKKFIADYSPIKDTADKVFRNLDDIINEVKKGLAYAKYYFPQYKLPTKLITFIGPLDAHFQGSLGSYGDIITNDGLAVGLQLHLGKNYSVYHTELGQQLYPEYLSRRFEPAYIPVNCMKNLIDDLFPERVTERPLIDQMIEKGKRLYILDKLLPFTPDSLKIGYTQKQLEGCYKNEASIWNLFLQNNFLYSIEPAVNKNYLQDGPKTEELGDASPGFIGLFVGWQIVKKYMDKNPKLSLGELMGVDSRKVFEEAGYKPRN
jgi:hypothetical protein